MTFSAHLAQLRKNRGWTQADLAEAVEISLPQIQRYESGKSQPTLDAIKRISVALGVSSDQLIFDPSERQPDQELLHHFEAVKGFSDDERNIVLSVIEGLIIKHDARKWERRRKPEPV
jgi:transcriptional regulator with XRE-family HTH domain